MWNSLTFEKMYFWPTPLINLVDCLFLSVSRYGYVCYALVASIGAFLFHCMTSENTHLTP